MCCDFVWNRIVDGVLLLSFLICVVWLIWLVWLVLLGR